MSSNKYYKEWKKNQSSCISSNSSLQEDDEFDKLNRILDKIKTEEKAKKIFEFGRSQRINQTFTAYVEPKYIMINGIIYMSF